MKIDAVLTGATGALMLGGAWWLDELLDLDPKLLWVAGVVLIVCVFGLVSVSRQNPINPAHVEVAVGINLVWAAGCLAIAFSDWTNVNALGIGFLMLQLMVVVFFAVLQAQAIRSVPERKEARASLP